MPEPTRASPVRAGSLPRRPWPNLSEPRFFLRAAKFSDWAAPDKLRLCAKCVTNTCQVSELI